MARKNEFQPDKPKSVLINRLHLTRLQRKKLLKWVLYSLVLLALSLVQDVMLCHFRVLGASTDLVPCAIFMICLLEGMESGSLFALISSAIYLFSGSAPGIYALVLLTFIAIFASYFRQAFLQKGFSAAMLCTVLSLFLYELLVFAFGLFLGQAQPGWILSFVLTAGMTSLTAPILYPVLIKIGSIGGEVWKE